MSNFENFNKLDPFADTGDDDKPSTANKGDYIHIRIQQRNGRKTLTTIQGLPTDLDPKRILKALRKDFACNGSIATDEALGEVIQLQGDQRTKVHDFITNKDGLGIDKKNIKIHGF
jgi:translation initiation factor 1